MVANAQDASHCFIANHDGLIEQLHFANRRIAQLIAEEGRRLASEREDLIATGIDPSDLAIPLYPQEPPRKGERP